MTEKQIPEVPQKLLDSFQETTQLIAENIVAAQERNMKFVQSTFTSAVEVLRSNLDATRALMQDLEQQTRKQQEAFQKLAPGGAESQWMETSMAFLRAPLTSYQQTLDAAEKATRLGLETFDKAVEEFEKVSQQFSQEGSKRASKKITP
jgi:vacuolar-type H+-ATPase subunit H